LVSLENHLVVAGLKQFMPKIVYITHKQIPFDPPGHTENIEVKDSIESYYKELSHSAL